MEELIIRSGIFLIRSNPYCLVFLAVATFSGIRQGIIGQLGCGKVASEQNSQSRYHCEPASQQRQHSTILLGVVLLLSSKFSLDINISP